MADLEEMADSAGFQTLRDQVLVLTDHRPQDRVLDVGAGTGLLTFALAPGVSRVWALDNSEAMCDYLEQKLRADALSNVEVVRSSATDLPLEDESVDLVVSNYCYHHLRDADKEHALGEAWRVLRPGGRLVIGDMMFRVGLADPRNRSVIMRSVWTMLRRGPAGLIRLLKNAVRLLAGRWEHPADVTWWEAAVARSGFEGVTVHALDHEGGIAVARRPQRAGPSIPAS